MIAWILKINWGKLLLTAFIYTVTSTVIKLVEQVFTQKYYIMPASLIFTFASGAMLTLVYYYLRDMLPSNFKKRVFLFADLLIGLQFVFFTLPVYLMFNVPAGLLVSWFISSFVILVITSFTCVKIIK